MVMEGAPMTVDLDGDGDVEIITAAYQAIIAVDGSGEEFWRFSTRGRYSTYPAILERPGATPLIYAGDNRGLFSCIDGAGDVVWQTETASIFCAAPALGDIDADGMIEVVQCDQSGAVSVFDALTGNSVWTYRLDGEGASPAIGDLDGDGIPEIVMTTGTGTVYALDATGSVVWEYAMPGTTPNWHTCSPVLFGDSRGQTRVAVASGEERIYCLDSQGAVLWDHPTRGSIASTISVGDYDGDGRADIFAVTQLGTVYRFDEDGRTIWDIDTQGRCLAPGAIIDIDGDGALDYALCSQQGNLILIDDAGEIVFSHQFDNRTINVTPAFGDIDPRRPGLEFAITGGESGRVYCFSTSAPVDTRAQWRTYRGDNRLAGAWFGLTRSDEHHMVPNDLSWDGMLTGDAATFSIRSPQTDAGVLRADASCMAPDGARYAATGRIAGRTGLLELPVSITAPGVYRFEWSLMNAAGERLVDGARELTLQPYVADQALARRAVLALRNAVGADDAASSLTGIGAALHRESQEIEAEADALAALQAAAPGAVPAFLDKLDARTSTLNARAHRGFALVKVAEAANSAGLTSPIALFEGTMWENRDVDTQLPATVSTPLRIERRCVPGEHEPVSIKVFNVTLDTVLVGAGVDADRDGLLVAAFEVQAVPTYHGDVAWDPMVPLGARQIAIPPLATREVFLDIDLGNVGSGSHRIDITLDAQSAQDDAGSSGGVAQITLDVLPFEMAGSDAMWMCNWASYAGDAVSDLLAHGNNVFITGLPPATMSEGTVGAFEIDFTRLEEFIAPLTGHKVFLLMNGMPSLGVDMEEDAYVPRLAEYLDRLFEFLADRGFSEDRVALYPHDEPGGHGWDTVNHYIAFARQGLKARPTLKFYVNGGGDLPMFEALNEVAAIWCPGYYMLPDDSPEMNFLRQSGKEIWSYDCGYSYARPIGAFTKTINVAGQYRMAAPFGLNFGATCIGYWCYNNGPSMWGPIAFEYPLVYLNEDDTNTSSRRWEAVREGMEDARILIALRAKLADPAVGEPTRERIRHLLDVSLPAFASQSLDEVRTGAARYVLDATNNDESVAAFRSEMLDCVESLVR